MEMGVSLGSKKNSWIEMRLLENYKRNSCNNNEINRGLSKSISYWKIFVRGLPSIS
jgi:hypothetical protein